MSIQQYPVAAALRDEIADRPGLQLIFTEAGELGIRAYPQVRSIQPRKLRPSQQRLRTYAGQAA